MVSHGYPNFILKVEWNTSWRLYMASSDESTKTYCALVPGIFFSIGT